MGSTFIVTSAAGSNRDQATGTRDQPHGDEHAAFIDHRVAAGVIMLGGPLPDEGGAVLGVRASAEAEVRDRLQPDPWSVHGILIIQSVRRWDIFIDRWVAGEAEDRRWFQSWAGVKTTHDEVAGYASKDCSGSPAAARRSIRKHIGGRPEISPQLAARVIGDTPPV
jgi:hypothetical protein